MGRRLVPVLVAALLALAGAATARADGDPASDVLFDQWLFLPSDASVPPRSQAELEGLVRSARKAGFPVKVALIDSSYDLGSVTVLWRKPQTYARFLGTELSVVYHGRLLIVMPNGLGLYHGKRPTATDERALRGVAIGHGGAGLAAAAIRSIRLLASAHGVALAPVHTRAPAPAARPSRASWVPRAMLAGGLVVILVAWAVSLRLRPPRLSRQPRGGKT